MNYPLIIGIESGVCLLLLLFLLFYRNKVNKEFEKNQSVTEQIEKKEQRLSNVREEIAESIKQVRKIQQEIASNEDVSNKKKSELEKAENELEDFLIQRKEQQNKINANLKTAINQFQVAKEKYEVINQETKALQQLQSEKNQLQAHLESHTREIEAVQKKIIALRDETDAAAKKKQEIMSRLDLYSRLDDFVAVGHYEEPTYLHETSSRFAEEIKRVRLKQKDLIKEKKAVTYPHVVSITSDDKTDKKILSGQTNLMLSSFNTECDFLIKKVRPSNISRTLEQIDKLATKLEKSAATLHCGFNIEYVKLKYEECSLQYQYALKKQDEQEEQRLIKERMREEVKAQKEFEKAISEAQKEERMYRKMLERAKESLESTDEDARLIAQQRIEDLEKQLAEAQEKEERAKSLAEQTRKGHVYVISNIGSFGKGIYKIGLTRRLDPLDRVKELGDASVPFRFDVHAIIHAEDAPALEATLHRKFKDRRVNSVNFRKEFFRTNLTEIQEAVHEIVDNEIDFKMTALAEEYYESRRLREELVN